MNLKMGEEICNCICKSNDQYIEVNYYDQEQVICNHCGMRGPLEYKHDDAIKKWNYIIQMFNRGECYQWT